MICCNFAKQIGQKRPHHLVFANGKLAGRRLLEHRRGRGEGGLRGWEVERGHAAVADRGGEAEEGAPGLLRAHGSGTQVAGALRGPQHLRELLEELPVIRALACKTSHDKSLDLPQKDRAIFHAIGLT